MPRLKAAVQIRKETALEALRDALKSAGKPIRPRLGCADRCPLNPPTCGPGRAVKIDRRRPPSPAATLRTERPLKSKNTGPGYGAVRLALSHWLDSDFAGVGDKERLSLLRAATQWDTERNYKAGPHARIDVEKHASLTKELIEWLEAPEAAAKAAASARAPCRAPTRPR